MKARLLYVNGNPFHLPGTLIYEEADGKLTYECPHCGRHPVPRHASRDLVKYAQKRTASPRSARVP